MEITVRLEGFSEEQLKERLIQGVTEGLRYKMEALVHSVVTEVVGNEFRRQLRDQFQAMLTGGAAVPMRDPENAENWIYVTLGEFVDAYMTGRLRTGNLRDRDRLGHAVDGAVRALMPDLLKEFVQEHGTEIKAAAAAKLEVELLERIMRR